MNLKEKVKNLPLSPGVYLMKDSLGEVIYVGKSKKLKNRVQSYFQNSKARSPKVEKLVTHLKDFDYILTDTEFEAFMLECKLINEIKPLYNRKMKNPLAYPYISIQLNEDFPAIKVVYFPEEAKDVLYFGPYTSKGTVEKVLEGIKEFYKINCNNPSKNSAGCLKFSLGLCIGMCNDLSTSVQYNTIVKKISAFLNGNDKSLVNDIEKEMLSACEKFDFEAAARYRDLIASVNYLLNKEKVISFTELNQNIVMFEKLDEDNIKVFLIKRNKVLFSSKYDVKKTEISELITIIKENILIYFNNCVDFLPLELSKNELDESEIIYSYLKSNNCSYSIISENHLNFKNDSTIDETLYKLLIFS